MVSLGLEELRKRRLRIFGGRQDAQQQQQQQQQQQAPLPEPAPQHPPQAAAAPPASGPELLSPEDTSGLARVLWPPGPPVVEDINRWHEEGLAFQHDSAFGLRQTAGGPCGVLAVLQAELLRVLLFGATAEEVVRAASGGAGSEGADEPVGARGQPEAAGASPQLPAPSVEERSEALAEAVLIVLARAAAAPESGGTLHAVAVQETAEHAPGGGGGGGGGVADFRLLPSDLGGATGALVAWRFALSPAGLAAARAHLRLAVSSPGGAFAQAPGMLLIACSIALSRGLDALRAEMDPGSDGCLTAQFGHCTQELVNLCLAGRAFSNVFDGDYEMAPGFSLRGPQGRSAVGYLTHLEALRFCAVGDFLKKPRAPLWVVASSSHFTVLFATDLTAVQASPAELHLERARRAFARAAGAAGGPGGGGDEEGSILQLAALAAVLEELGLTRVVHERRDGLTRLQQRLELPGTGVVVWGDFWSVASRLLSGESLARVLGEEPAAAAAAAAAAAPGLGGRVGDQGAPPRVASVEAALPWAGAGASEADVAGGGAAESDEEMARRLQAQFDAEMGGGATAGTGAIDPGGGSGGASTALILRPPSPGEAAAAAGDARSSASGASARGGGGAARLPGVLQVRELEACEGDHDGGHPAPMDTGESPAGGASGGDEGVASSVQAGPGEVLLHLFHYNGLDGAATGGRRNLTPFRLVHAAAGPGEVGAGGLSVGGSTADHSKPFVEVLRTRWPDARIDWQGHVPPSID